MKNLHPIIVGIGELLWDIFPTEKRAGGAPVNFVYHATQMGAEGYAISAVGKDSLGTEILEELDKNGIQHCIRTVEYPTGRVIVNLQNGIPSYIIAEDVAWDHIPLTQEAIDITRKADAICFGTLAQRSEESRKTLHSLLSYIPTESLRFFDINIRQSYYSKELIVDLLSYANILKMNDEELDILRSMFSLTGSNDDICRWFVKKFSLRFLILTAGSSYSSIYTASEMSTLATPSVDVCDTVGAGDSFSGAFVYSILIGKNLVEAHKKAVDVAAFVCTQRGAWPAYPHKNSLV